MTRKGSEGTLPATNALEAKSPPSPTPPTPPAPPTPVTPPAPVTPEEAKRLSTLAALPAGTDTPTLNRALKVETPEETMHAEDVTDEEGAATGERRLRFEGQTPLDAYYRRGKIDWRQHDAGSWLERTYRRAVRTGPKGSFFGDRVQSSNTPDAPVLEGAYALRVAFVRAGLAYEDDDGRVALRTPGKVAIHVCGHGEWAGGTRNLNRLCEALDALAAHLCIGTKRAPEPRA